MLEIVSLPFAAAEEPNGREHVFLRAFLNIIQNFTLDAMEKDTNAYGGLGLYNIDIFKTKNMGIVFSKDDLSNGITQEIKDKYFDKDILAIDENYADSFRKASWSATLWHRQILVLEHSATRCLSIRDHTVCIISRSIVFQRAKEQDSSPKTSG